MTEKKVAHRYVSIGADSYLGKKLLMFEQRGEGTLAEVGNEFISYAMNAVDRLSAELLEKLSPKGKKVLSINSYGMIKNGLKVEWLALMPEEDRDLILSKMGSIEIPLMKYALTALGYALEKQVRENAPVQGKK